MKLEHPVVYSDMQTGWIPCQPGELQQVITRYLYALTYISDMPAEQRGSYLDFGCGTGFGTELLSPAFRHSAGVDNDPVALDYARRIHNRAGTWYELAPKLPNAPFDFVTLLEVIEHMQVVEADALLHKLASLMTNHAILFATTPVAIRLDGSNPDNPYHVHEYQPGELKALLERHFKDVQVAPLIGRFFNAVCRGPKR